MNSRKTLIGIAVASTFAWAGAAHAGGGHHHTSWVASGEEIYPPMMFSEGTRSSELAGSAFQGEQAIGGTAQSGTGTVGGSFLSEPRAESRFGDNESSARDGSSVEGAGSGVYSDYYLVAAEPMMPSDWDAYLIAFEPENADILLLIDDTPYLVSTYDVILLPSDFAESSANPSSTGEQPAG